MKNNIIEISLAYTKNVSGSACNCICRDVPISSTTVLVNTFVGEKNVRVGREERSAPKNVDTEVSLPVFSNRNESIKVIGLMSTESGCKQSCNWLGYPEYMCKSSGM